MGVKGKVLKDFHSQYHIKLGIAVWHRITFDVGRAQFDVEVGVCRVQAFHRLSIRVWALPHPTHFNTW